MSSVRETAMENSEYCLNCKREISADNFMLHSAHCQRNITLCRKCDQPVPSKDMESHEKEEHAVIRCSKCSKKMEQWELEPHNSVCSKRNVECKYCEIVCIFNDLADHENYCGSRTELCPECKRFIKITDKKEHETTNCEKIRIDSESNSEKGQSFASNVERNVSVDFSDITAGIKNLLRPLGFDSDSQCSSMGERFNDSAVGNDENIQTDTLGLDGRCYPTSSGISHSNFKIFPTDDGSAAICQPTCPVCQKVIWPSEVGSHLENCSSQLYECPICYVNVPYFKKKEHEASCFEWKKQFFLSSRNIASTAVSENDKKLSKNQKKKQRKRMSENVDIEGSRVAWGQIQRNIRVQLPCEFCEKCFPEDELILHQSGCRPELFQKPASELSQTQELPTISSNSKSTPEAASSSTQKSAPLPHSTDSNRMYQRDVYQHTLVPSSPVQFYLPRPRLMGSFMTRFEHQTPHVSINSTQGRGYRFRGNDSTSPGMFLGWTTTSNPISDSKPVFSDAEDLYKFCANNTTSPPETTQGSLLQNLNDSRDADSTLKDARKSFFDCQRNFYSGNTVGGNETQQMGQPQPKDNNYGRQLDVKCGNKVILNGYSSDEESNLDDGNSVNKKSSFTKQFLGARPKFPMDSPKKLSPEKKMNNRKNKKKK